MAAESLGRSSGARNPTWLPGALVALGLASWPAWAGPGAIPWKTGAVGLDARAPADVAATLEALAAAAPAGVQRVVVQFDRPVDEAARAALAEGGVRLLGYLGAHAYFATVTAAELDVPRLAGAAGLAAVSAVQPEWKLHPLWLDGPAPAWAVVGAAPEGTPLVGAYLLLHADVDLERDGLDLLAAYGVTVRDVLESVNGLVIELPQDLIPALAGEDAVMWIEPPLPPLSTTNDSNRARTEANLAQAAPYNLTGAGVTVLVYDGGTARATHVDFQGRLHVRDASGQSYHATHVAGTIGGAGVANAAYKGMAPAVTLESYGFEYDGSGTFLYTNPGDIESDYSQAISSYGAVIANNSIGTNTEINGFSCSIQGDYGVTDRLIDTIVRGDGSNPLFTAPLRVIWAAGNERQGDRCDVEGYGDYYSTAPPAGAKNHIAVGAVNSNNDTMTNFSSWGPVDDGRLKPDMCAPGCQSDGDGGVTSCDSSSTTAYRTLCGTSMACPTTTGIAALLIEDFRVQFPGQPLFRNSTLKAWLAHTAVDLGNPGPDYQFGYGSVRIKQAIDLMRSGAFVENSVGQGGVFARSVEVLPGDPELRVTLAWDDVPGTPNVSPALVNDLDLRVFGPTGTRFYPWTLNPANPGAPAVQTQADHVNNIEQVLVASPQAGTWTVEVYGYNVPQGPQPFSLVGDGAYNVGTYMSLPAGTPATMLPGQPQVIDVQITTIGETVVPGSPTLHYRYDGGTYLTAPLAHVGGSLYQATLPPATCTDTPEYFFSAEGSETGPAFLPPDAPAATCRTRVGEMVTLFADDFETDTGWVPENLGATSGDWQRGIPVNDPNWAYDPTGDCDGSGRCWLTQNQSGNTDVDNGAVRLTSPVLDMSGGDITISYCYFLELTNATGGVDRLLVEINNGGPAWIEIARHTTDNNLNWTTHTITQADLDAAGVVLTPTMRLRFTANDADPQSIVESGLDAFIVRGLQCTGPADTTPPSPDPMSFAAPPAPLSTAAIGMTATTATDAQSPPVEYHFDFVSGGPGGAGSDWIAATDYTNSGLAPNTAYTYRVSARDSAGPPNQTAYSAPATTATLIETPTGVAFGTVTSSSIELLATGPLTNLTAGSAGLFFDSLTPGGDGGINLWVQSTSDTATGLSPNTAYTFQVKARNQNAVETPYGPADTIATLANVPAAPLLANPTPTTLDLDVAPGGNPAATEFAILCTATTDPAWNGRFVGAAGLPAAAEVWQTDAAWGTITLLDLEPETLYTLAVKARNLDGVETVLGPAASLATGSQPAGACCFPDGSCAVAPAEGCATAGGSYRGDGTTCTPNPCPVDCNGNGIDDALDIADCDGSPWCGDCNANGVPDGCDLAAGSSSDANGNGIPDECELRPGDLNCDGVVDFYDIDPFVVALSGQAAYEAAYPDCHWLNADCDLDGAVSFDDIDAFVPLIGG